MKNFLIIISFTLLVGCKKNALVANDVPATAVDSYIKYSILKNGHYCDKTVIKTFTGVAMNLKVKFDSTAIYSNIDPQNQYDINKLVGFTEGTDNHVNSARMGWGWNDNALRLYAYSYADSVRNTKEICAVAIGETFLVNISVTEYEYIFRINEKTVTLPRAIHTTSVSGYWQFPYFGGNEVAPQDIYIYMQELAK